MSSWPMLAKLEITVVLTMTLMRGPESRPAASGLLAPPLPPSLRRAEVGCDVRRECLSSAPSSPLRGSPPSPERGPQSYSDAPRGGCAVQDGHATDGGGHLG